jgi:two-component system, NtrC family, sensor kinase
VTDSIAEAPQQLIADLQRRLDESLAQQAATADVLKIISRSAFDLQTVLETLITSAVKLCGANRGAIFLRESDVYPLRAASSATPEFLQFWAANPPRAGRGSATARVIASGKVEVIADVLTDPEMQMPANSLNRIRGTLGVPMLRDTRVEGVMVLTRPEPGPFTQSQIDLVQTFADQAVIAIENTRLFNETTEALDYQSASAGVLQVIGKSMADAQPVFERIVDSIERLFDHKTLAIFLTPGDGLLHMAARRGMNAESMDRIYPLPVEQTAVPLVLEARKQVYIPDALHGPGVPDSIRAAAKGIGNFSDVLTPLLWEGRGVGMIAVTREANVPFSERELSLLRTFADQAVIAIENTRLFNETKEALQHQTATSEVLQVISRSPGELDPVFQTILSRATSICDAQFGLLLLYERGGFRCTSTFNLPPAFAETFLRNPVIYPPPIDPLGRLIETRKLVHVVDVKREEAFLTGFPPIIELVELGGARTLLLVPMLRENDMVGVIAIFRQTVHAFSDKQIDLVTSFGSQAVIAIENTRLFSETQEALERQTATSEVLRVINASPGELDPVFQTILANATRICDAQFGNLFVLEEGGGFRCASTINLPPAFAETFFRQSVIHPPPIDPLGRVIATRRHVQVVDVKQEPAYVTGFRPFVEVVELGGARAILLVPMLKDDVLVGVIAIFRQTVHAFSDKEIDLVTSFGSQAVIAIENARLLHELHARTKELSLSLDELRTAQDRLIQTEKLASLGQLTAGIAHEIKNPLNFVNNFSALSTDLITELNDLLGSATIDAKVRAEIDELTGLLKGNLEKVVQHGKRADSIVKNMLVHSREGSGEHRAAAINAIVEESLNLAYHGARAEKSGFNITLSSDLDPSAGMIEVYPQEITRVLLNLISNGFYAATKRKETGDDGFEPSLTATTKNLGNKVEIRIRDNGTGIPPEVKEKMFNPFFTTKPAGEGTGLGLSMSHDIVVKQHGGKIDVDTEPGQFTEFIITLPRAAAKT